MKIEIVKKINVNEEVWYHVKVDGWTIDSFKREIDAITSFNKIKKNIANGLPKEEIIKSEPI